MNEQFGIQTDERIENVNKAWHMAIVEDEIFNIDQAVQDCDYRFSDDGQIALRRKQYLERRLPLLENASNHQIKRAKYTDADLREKNIRILNNACFHIIQGHGPLYVNWSQSDFRLESNAISRFGIKILDMVLRDVDEYAYPIEPR